MILDPKQNFKLDMNNITIYLDKPQAERNLGNNLFLLFSVVCYCNKTGSTFNIHPFYTTNEELRRVLNLDFFQEHIKELSEIDVSKYFQWSDLHYADNEEQHSINGIETSQSSNVFIVGQSLLYNYNNIKEYRSYLLENCISDAVKNWINDNLPHRFVLNYRSYKSTTLPCTAKLYTDLTSRYYVNAMYNFGIDAEEIQNDTENELDIVIVSDDINEAKKQLGKTFRYAEFIDEDFFQDFCQLVHGQYLVLANSSFSVMGAFFNASNVDYKLHQESIRSHIIRPESYYTDIIYNKREQKWFFNPAWSLVPDLNPNLYKSFKINKRDNYIHDYLHVKQDYSAKESFQAWLNLPTNSGTDVITSLVPKCGNSTISALGTDILGGKETFTHLSPEEWRNINRNYVFIINDTRVTDNEHRKVIFWRDPIERILSALNYPLSDVSCYNETVNSLFSRTNVGEDVYIDITFSNLRIYLLSVINTLRTNKLVDTNIHIVGQYNMYYHIYKDYVDEQCHVKTPSAFTNIEVVKLHDMTEWINTHVAEDKLCSNLQRGQKKMQLNQSPASRYIDINKLPFTDEQKFIINQLIDQLKELYKEDYAFMDSVTINNKLYKPGKVNAAVISLCKEETRYLKEFCYHYIDKIGFSTVYIVDNNDIERRITLDDINNTYQVIPGTNSPIRNFNKEEVKVIHYNNKTDLCDIERDYSGDVGALQLKLYNDVIIKDINNDSISYNILNKHDWLLLADADEFIEFRDTSVKIDEHEHTLDSKLKDHVYDFGKVLTVSDFINDYVIPNHYDAVSIPWMIFSDNNILDDDKETNKPVQDRFTRPTFKDATDKWIKRYDLVDPVKSADYNLCNSESDWQKMLFSTRDVKDITTHIVEFHNPADKRSRIIKKFNWEDYVNNGDKEIGSSICYYLKHYRTKSLQEYFEHKFIDLNINKCNIGRAASWSVLKPYFYFNQLTADKLLRFCSFFNKYNIYIEDVDFVYIMDCFNDARYSPLTIIIRTNNRKDKLKACLESLRNQTIHCNVIVGCDNCTDGTPEWLCDWLKQEENKEFAPFVSYFVQKRPVGPGGNNEILKTMVNTRYLIGMDDDDEYCWEHTIETIYNSFINKPEAYFYRFDPDKIENISWSWVNYVMDVNVLHHIRIINEYCNDDWFPNAVRAYCRAHKALNIPNHYFNGAEYEAIIDIPDEFLDDKGKLKFYKYNCCGELASTNTYTYNITNDYYLMYHDFNLQSGSTEQTSIEEKYKFVRKQLQRLIDIQYRVAPLHIHNTLKQYFDMYVMELPFKEREDWYNKFYI